MVPWLSDRQIYLFLWDLVQDSLLHLVQMHICSSSSYMENVYNASGFKVKILKVKGVGSQTEQSCRTGCILLSVFV
ncbi:hypothetical protein L1987_45522 [Smallanthus sonchifolius]|uniref:Uncharacterized protein n=1 Tax=Smallanthus sonchifolius TaxID=185202 RepID=A0ACB9FWZ7_9ASTR|nr:hypothetical protein L1987_45522 [Smallanthus sonchifolius]